MTIHLLEKAQILLLRIEKVTVLDEYLYYANVFIKKSVEVLLKHIEFIKYIFKFKENK